MDWILISNILSVGLIPFFFVAGIYLLIGIISFFVCAADGVLDDWKEIMNTVKLPCLYISALVLSFGMLIALVKLPKILVETNVDKIKLRYTNMQTVKQVESGALEVVKKLDKLISKGIKQLDEE